MPDEQHAGQMVVVGLTGEICWSKGFSMSTAGILVA